MFYCKRVAHQLPVQHETLHLFPKRKISSKVDAFSGYEFCIYYFCIEEDPEKYKISGIWYLVPTIIQYVPCYF
jgi:hypothetical protein